MQVGHENYSRTAVAIYDAEAKLFAANVYARELLGMSENDITGKLALGAGCRFFKADGSSLPYEEHPVNLAIRDKRPLIDQTLGMSLSNISHTLWVKESAIPLLDRKGNIDKVILTIFDVDDNK
jgi:hypothetical protein